VHASCATEATRVRACSEQTTAAPVEIIAGAVASASLRSVFLPPVVLIFVPGK